MESREGEREGGGGTTEGGKEHTRKGGYDRGRGEGEGGGGGGREEHTKVDYLEANAGPGVSREETLEGGLEEGREGVREVGREGAASTSIFMHGPRLLTRTPPNKRTLMSIRTSIRNKRRREEGRKGGREGGREAEAPTSTFFTSWVSLQSPHRRAHRWTCVSMGKAG